MAEDLITLVSARPFQQTLDGLIAALTGRGVDIFARIDHAANATAAGLELAPTTVVVFGSAKAGTPLMQAHQALGLDLPLRALVMQTTDGVVSLVYREPEAILARQGIAASGFASIAGMSALLAAVCAEAAGEPG